MQDTLKEIQKDISTINVTLAVNTQQLKDHMERTKLAEQSIVNLDKRTDALENRFFRIDGATKFIGLVLGAITFIDVILKIVEHLKLLR